jgi:hypothetical protein
MAGNRKEESLMAVQRVEIDQPEYEEHISGAGRVSEFISATGTTHLPGGPLALTRTILVGLILNL